MESSTILTIAFAIGIHFLVSPIPEVSTELYVYPYVLANILLYFSLLSRFHDHCTILTSLATTNLIFLTTSILLTTVRRVFFSPLRNFPGPKLAAVSGLWNANEARHGRASRTHRALHERLSSDIIRIGPNTLSVGNVDALDKLYGGSYLRGNFSTVFNLSGGDSVATIRDAKRHSVARRLLAKAFTKTEVSHMVERLHKHVNKTIRILHDKSGRPVNSGLIFDDLAFDAISDCAFSYDAGMQEGRGDLSILSLIHGFLKFASVVGHLPHLQQILRYLPMPPDGKKFTGLGNKILDAHQALEGPHHDILSHLLVPDRETGTVPSRQDVTQHIQLILAVGAHSVSTTLTCIFAALASRPDIQVALHKELDAAWDEDGDLLIGQVTRLRLLESVVKEGLRMFAPLQGGTPAIVPKGGVTLNTGEFLPEHTHVYVSQHVLVTQERYFSQAREFLPERWMEEQDAKKGGTGHLIGDRRAWIPFGYGAHACGGRALALEELRLIVARVAREFDISFRQHFNFDDWVDGIKDHFLTVIKEMPLRFVARTDG